MAATLAAVGSVPARLTATSPGASRGRAKATIELARRTNTTDGALRAMKRIIASLPLARVGQPRLAEVQEAPLGGRDAADGRRPDRQGRACDERNREGLVEEVGVVLVHRLLLCGGRAGSRDVLDELRIRGAFDVQEIAARDELGPAGDRARGQQSVAVHHL